MKYICVSLFLAIIFSVSCADKSRPNYEFFPNMYRSLGYETYQESSAFSNGVEAQLPPEGSIKRGWLPFAFENTADGYSLAKATLKNPLLNGVSDLSDDMNKGKELFDIYCAICHGKKGDGEGILVKREKFLGVPNYKDRDITQGSIYHTIYYGKNAMGSHASQLDEKERWQVALYVEELRNKLIK